MSSKVSRRTVFDSFPAVTWPNQTSLRSFTHHCYEKQLLVSQEGSDLAPYKLISFMFDIGDSEQPRQLLGLECMDSPCRPGLESTQ